MKKGIFVLTCIVIIAVLSGCSAKQNSVDGQNKQDQLQQPKVEQLNEATDDYAVETQSTSSDKNPPVIEQLDKFPFPVLSTWKEEKFEVRQYEEGMEWEAVFTFAGEVRDQALAYKEVIEELGYTTQTLLGDVFKIGTAEFAGINYHGTFTFSTGDQYSEWGDGQGYVKIQFSEKK